MHCVLSREVVLEELPGPASIGRATKACLVSSMPTQFSGPSVSHGRDAEYINSPDRRTSARCAAQSAPSRHRRAADNRSHYALAFKRFNIISPNHRWDVAKRLDRFASSVRLWRARHTRRSDGKTGRRPPHGWTATSYGTSPLRLVAALEVAHAVVRRLHLAELPSHSRLDVCREALLERALV